MESHAGTDILVFDKISFKLTLSEEFNRVISNWSSDESIKL